MRKFYFLVVLLTLLQGCRNSGDNTSVSDAAAGRFPVDSLPEKAGITAGGRQLLDTWEAFFTMDQSIDAIYRTGNREELRLLLEELIEELKEVESSDYPPALDNAQVKSRLKVFKTYLLKANASLEYRTDPLEAVGEMLEAYNALCREFTILKNNSLDAKLLQDE
jgi:hypothetical protein